MEVARPQPRLIAAGAALDFDDHVLLVVGVLLHHREANLLFQALAARAGAGEQLAHLCVLAVLAEQLLRARRVVLRSAPLGGQLRRGLQLAVGAPGLRVARAVAYHRGVGQLRAQLGEARLDLLDEVFDHRTSLWAL